MLVEAGGRHYDVGERPWQQVVAVENLRRIAQDLERGGWAVRAVPDLEHVEVDPDRLSLNPPLR